MKKSLFLSIIVLLVVTTSCTFDTSGLKPENTTAVCGDGTIDSPEECEPTVNIDTTCIEIGYTGGNLSCTTECTIDKSLCEGSCNNCNEGEEKCGGNSIYFCELNSDGCTNWVLSTNCTDLGTFCSVIGTTAQCEDTCTSNCSFAGETRCLDDVSTEICKVIESNTHSCLVWESNYQCQIGTACNDEGDTATCIECVNCTTELEQKCSIDDHAVETCSSIGINGCTDWVVENCINGGICDPVSLTCTPCNNCTAGTRRCSQDLSSVEVCSQSSNECTYWNQLTDCDPLNFNQCVDNGTTAQCLGVGDDCDIPFTLTPASMPFTYHINNFNSQFDNGLDIQNCQAEIDNRTDMFIQLFLNSGETIHISTTGEFDSMIKVLDGSMACDNTNLCLIGRDTGYREDLYFEAPLSGNYIVVVEAYNETPSTPDFDLNIQYVTSDLCSETEIEPNNSFSNSNSFTASLPSRLCQRMYSDPDVDCATFSLPSGSDSITIVPSSAFDPNHCPGNITVEVYDSSENLILTNEGLSDWCDKMEEIKYPALANLTPGEYTICTNAPEAVNNHVGYSKTAMFISTDRSTILLDEQFSMGDIPGEWGISKNPTNAPKDWQYTNLMGDGSARVESGISTDNSTMNYLLVTPVLDFTTLSSFVKLAFKEKADRSTYNNNDVRSFVYVTNDNLTTWYRLGSFDSDESSWIPRNLDLTRFIGQANIQIIFLFSDTYHYADSYFWEVDDILVYGQ
jgi:hypothetical protein